MSEFGRVGREVRKLVKMIDDLGRRQAASHMTGPVAKIDGNRVRLELMPARNGGEPFLSPWVQLQDSAGSTGSHTPVAIGDPMRLLSPHGELGPQSIAIRDSHTEDKPNPANDPDELVIAHAGCEIRMSAGELLLKKGGTTIRVTDNGIFEEAASRNTNGGSFTHNQVNVGDTHKHDGVEKGNDLTGPPS